MDSTKDKRDRRELVRENSGSAWSVLWTSEYLGPPDPPQRNAVSELLGISGGPNPARGEKTKEWFSCPRPRPTLPVLSAVAVRATQDTFLSSSVFSDQRSATVCR